MDSILPNGMMSYLGYTDNHTDTENWNYSFTGSACSTQISGWKCQAGMRVKYQLLSMLHYNVNDINVGKWNLPYAHA